MKNFHGVEWWRFIMGTKVIKEIYFQIFFPTEK